MAGTMIEFASNGSKTAAYLSTPASGKGPGVIVLQEWWGLVGHIKNVCDRFAAEGFTALAPDMYHGKTASEPDGAGKLFMALNIEQAEKDLRGAVKHLAGHSSTAKLGAVVNFYGVHPNVKPDYSKLSGPVLGLFGEKDGFVSPEVARGVEAAIKKAGKQVEIKIYAGRDHAFFNDENKAAYHKADADDAWKRTTG